MTIADSTHPLAQARFDRGPVDPGLPMDRVILVLGASAGQEHDLRAFLDSQQTKGSPDYHHWLTPEQFGERFGPSPQDVQQVTGWLQQQGFQVNSVAKSNRWIEFSGTAAQVQAAFQTEMHTYQVEGQLHAANASDITIPAALAPVVRGVLSLHNFYSRPMIVRSPRKVTGTMVKGRPGITFSDGSHAVVPGDFATIYDLNPLYTATPTNFNGAGQTIAIVAVSNITVSDVTNFRSLFGLPANNPNIILNGPDPGEVPGADEATLDTEWSGAVAPNATIDLVVSGGTLTTDPIALSSLFIVEQNLGQIMNVSFGECESQLGSSGNQFWQELWEQAAAQGISVFVSSGDTGAAGCAPNMPSATPAATPAAVSGFASTDFNTAVGGTEFNETVSSTTSDATFWAATNSPANQSSALGYIPEMIWNDSCTPDQPNSLCTGPNATDFVFASSGGGVSTVSAVPSWQMLSITGLTGAGFNFRVLPDVSLNAALHDPYVFCFSTPNTPDCQTSGGMTTFNSLAGGTSFSSPAFAGIMAIVNQKTLNDHPAKVATDGRQGLANYVLYPLAASESASGFVPCNSNNFTIPTNRTTCVFNDITVGNNTVPGVTGFGAGTGFDLGSGLGSVDANNLAKQWSSLAGVFQGTATTLTATTPISITHGQSVTFAASVARMGSTGTPSGDVSLIAQGGNLANSMGVSGSSLTPSGTPGTANGNLTTNDLPGGSNYTVSAFYPGDGTFAGSTSSSITVMKVNPENSTTTLNPLILNQNSGNVTPGTSVAYGDPVNILAVDAKVQGASGQGFPTGQVTFSDGSTSIGPIALDNSGISELGDCFAPLPACLTPGTHSITTSYLGDSSFGPSNGAAVTITVTAGTPAVTVTAPATAATGVPFTISALVNPGLGTIAVTGTLQFFDGTTSLGAPLAVSSNQASMPVTLNAGGNHSLTAQYASNETTTYTNATSAATPVNVTAPFSFTAPSNSQTIAAGGTATYNVTLAANGGFTGTVTLACTGAPGGATCAPNPSSVSLTSTTTSVPVTVMVTNTANARLAPLGFHSLPVAFAGVLAGFLLWGVKKKPARAALVVLAIGFVLGMSSCGGGNSTPPPKPNTVAMLTVTGTSGSTTNSVTLTLTITH